MRAIATLIPFLAAAATAAAQDRIPIRPDEAVLACSARAGHQIETRHGGAAKPARRFETLKLDDGWRVRGVYLTVRDDAGSRFTVECEVTAAGVDLVMTQSSR